MTKPHLKRQHVKPHYQGPTGQASGAAGVSTDAARPDGAASGLVRRYDKHHRASDKVVALGWIKATYAEAIEYAGITKDMRGMALAFGATFGVAAVWLALYMGYEAFDNGIWIEKILGAPIAMGGVAVGLYVFLWMSRLELFRPEDEPTVFDRKNRKVYRIARDVEPGIAGLFKRWPLSACEYDWDLIDAEHHATLSTTGSTAYRTHELTLVVRSSATDPTIVDGFRIGNAQVLNEALTDAVWEHIRRFMEEEGPHLPSPNEPLADRTAPDSLWQSMGVTGPFGPKYIEWWRDAPGLTMLSHLFFPAFAPVWFIWAVCHWLSYKTATSIAWPQAVIQAIGPARSARG